MPREFGLLDLSFLLVGLKWTLALSAIAFVGGGLVGILVALARTSRTPALRWLSYTYIELFTGTPLLLQLFVFYFGLSLLGFDVDPWSAAAIGFTAHASAFLGEIWRGSIEAVPRGQSEASHALGLSYWSTMVDVVLPQAMRISLPATVGFLVGLIKATSVASIIGFQELTRTSQIISNNTYQPLLAFSVAGAVYFLVCWPLSLFGARLENRMTNAA